MAGLYRVIRFVIVTLLTLAVAVPALLYAVLSVPQVQQKAKGVAEKELTALFGTKVSIGDLTVTPFNRLTLRKVAVEDCNGDTALKVRRLGAGLSIGKLLWGGRLVFNYAEIIGLDAKISRDSIGAPLNIQCIIDALKPKDKNKPPAEFDFAVNAIVIRQSSLSYDVRNAPWESSGIDRNHISIKDLRADLRLPRMQRDDYTVDLRRLAFRMPSSFSITGLECQARLTPSVARIDKLDIELPSTLLAFAPMVFEYGDWGNLDRGRISHLPLRIELLDGSHFSFTDFRPLLRNIPTLASSQIDGDIRLTVAGTPDSLSVDDLYLSLAERAGGTPFAVINAQVSAIGLLTDPRSSSFDLKRLAVTSESGRVAAVAGIADLSDLLSSLGTARIEAEGSLRLRSGTPELASAKLDFRSDAGNLVADATMKASPVGDYEIAGKAEMENIAIRKLLAGFAGQTDIPGSVTGNVTADLTLLKSKGIGGSAALRIEEIEFRGSEFHDLDLVVKADGKKFDVDFEVDNQGLEIDLQGMIDLNDPSHRRLNFEMVANDLDLGLLAGKQGHELSLTAASEMSLVRTPDGIQALDGKFSVGDLTLIAPAGKRLYIKNLSLDAVADTLTGANSEVKITSDILEAWLRGRVDPFTLPREIKSLASSLVPALFPEPRRYDRGRNDFSFNVRLLSTEALESFTKLPVQVRYPVVLDGSFSSPDMTASLDFSAPYLWQGNKEINATSMRLNIDGDRIEFPESMLTASTTMPTKNGRMTLDLSVTGGSNTATIGAAWKVDSNRDFSGALNFLASVDRDLSTGKTLGSIQVLPSELVFNDTVWNVSPSLITIRDKNIDVDRFRVGHQGQYVAINGKVSPSASDSVLIQLRDVDLDYVFETLNISNAMFGGIATGDLVAREVLTSRPVAYTDGLSVKGLKYNFSLMGDALIRADFDADRAAVNLSAVIDQPNGRHSSISGYIKPTTEGYIDLDMQADKIEVGFMKPFMEAFASAVGGYASGKAHLYGTFHDINMSGDIFAEDLSLKLDFTGTTYWATDSVHLQPGFIDLRDITLRDRDGNTGKLNGWLRHTNFHEPRFNFRISEAKDLLVYDVAPSPELIWYGTIYGDGGADITGVPGRIDIKVDMATAPKSTFTFVLSDAEEAYDYTFITFRDRDAGIAGSEEIDFSTPDIVKELRRSLAKKVEQESASIYNMDLTVRVNDNARLVVIMDPVGGDAIRALGDGVMTLTYNSASEELGLRGDYTLESGTYNFTFQDIIRKDFRIYPGSTIRFNGDPYSAQLNITAGYRLTANLSDLDESFLDDPELTRTSVPVEAEIIITGDMRQPEIDYDFSFPTLKDDVKRKVNSIVSTDDMRARQMLYLLALSRFYTPDYMSATKGNDLVSMASATLSSQLGNVLGQLTDKFSIAPNIRSDRGDFSDVEFDLALSSSLLNNRLLFNGNFGYRDKTLNNNTFIGDFDIEYLLNRSGSLRLKAYNRYNDQNFYVKNALTTQGVGVVYRRDFDDMLSFLKAFRRKKKDAPADSTDINLPDHTGTKQ